MTTFREWASAKGGAPSIAPLLGVTKRAVNFWLQGRGSPKHTTVMKILKLSGGKLTYEQIVKETRRAL